MRFFTYKNWQALQGRRFKAASAAWDQSSLKYQRVLTRLRPELGERNYRFFNSGAFHDGFVIGFEDGGKATMSLVIRKHDQVFRLEFREVDRFNLDYQLAGNEPAFLFEWGYEEFSKVRSKMLRLEVLFSSSATLTIDFGHLKISKM